MPEAPRVRVWLEVGGRFVLAYVLLTTFWASSPMAETALSILGGPRTGAWLSASALLGWVGLDPLVGALWALARWALGPGDYWRDYVFVSVVGAMLVPLVLARAIGPDTLDALGLRRPGRPALGLALTALLVSLPLSAAIALHPEFRLGVAEALGRSPWFLVAVPVGGAAEHFFFHGVLLAWLHPSGAFPPAHELVRPFVWPGKLQEGGVRAGVAASLASLAVPRSCLAPCLLSVPLFWAIHVGKPDAELWLSLPAGGIFAWLAYRTNGFVVPLLVHLSVPLAAALLVLATR